MTDKDVEKIIKANMMVQMNLAGIRADFEKALQRHEWVGLTDDDKKRVLDNDFGGNRADCMDAAEKILREKNHG